MQNQIWQQLWNRYSVCYSFNIIYKFQRVFLYSFYRNTLFSLCFSSFPTLIICVVAAMFIGLTVLACGKTTGTDLSSQPKTLIINNTTIYDLTDLHFICNNDSSSNEELSLVKAGSSETVELPQSSVYSIHVSGKAANGTSFSNTFSGTIDNSSSVTISLDDSANLSVIANIAD